ncbi:ImmA/IrrE family metallo-endopeptidase [Lysobacter antibioticus]|uniref:ImmA/IrrE family metallo-endopeptidase n=1 Tax=Lysobacter antibioticus TaxID=84531 RepID=UPI0009E850AE|nr:ImmA/IrrE family metallo-endopeptidase [Lysobacter antibioticus]
MISIADQLRGKKVSWGRIAKRSGISLPRINEIVGGAQANLSEVRKIAEALKLPLSSLLQGESGARSVDLLFRQSLYSGGDPFNQYQLIGSQIRDIISVIGEVNSGAEGIKDFQRFAASVAGPELLAEYFRQATQLGDLDPALQLSRIASEDLGIVIAFNRDSTIDGVSAIAGGQAVILLGLRSFKPRMLFTLAHELGHLFAHHGVDENFAVVDGHGVGDIRPPRKKEEKFADDFASALLLPPAGVLRLLNFVRDKYQVSGPLGDIEILTLARFYGVSFEVAARRCEQLELLPKGGAWALYQTLCGQHGNPERRADQLGLSARPEIEISTSASLLQRAVEKVKAGDLSIGRAAELINVPAALLMATNSRT